MTAQRTPPRSTPDAAFERLTLRAPDESAAERALAEAMAVGASGAEQREDSEGVTLLLYLPASARTAVREAVAAVLGEAALSRSEALEARDWSQAWKEGLRAIEISPRLRVRPSFDRSPAGVEQIDLVIDPGQAFGTGGHESTRLALGWLDHLAESGRLRGRVLDVGCGSGVLAIAALALGAEHALAFDLDPLAAPATAENAANNRAQFPHERLSLFIGPIETISAAQRFDGIVANMLRRELEGVIEALAARLDPKGWLVASGLLESELERWEARCAECGLERSGIRHERDASGTRWSALLMRHASG